MGGLGEMVKQGIRRAFERKEAREGVRRCEDRESVHGGRDFWAPHLQLSCGLIVFYCDILRVDRTVTMRRRFRCVTVFD